MRLINIRTLRLEEFVGWKPPYAILSHTWGDQEVSLRQYQDWRDRNPGTIPFEDSTIVQQEPWRRDTSALWLDIDESIERAREEEGPGMAKILQCAKRAQVEGHRYIWVDTCCIDKSSSTELQEAINSMFRWYEMSAVCYVHVADVNHRVDGLGALKDSRWFKRGWTLQELLAPHTIAFFDKNWEEIYWTSQMREAIEDATGIDGSYLGARSRDSRDASVATRMSWAADRETTRVEDMAYCLLGIFGINMPMLYGEGERAFQRLQEEIMKTSGDASIMAWNYSGTWIPLTRIGYHHDGLLATHPRQFAKCGKIEPHGERKWENSFSISQHGLEFEGPVIRDPVHRNLYYAVLACGLLVPWPEDANRRDIHLILPLLSIDRLPTTTLEGAICTREPWLVPIQVTQEFITNTGRAKIRLVRSSPRELISRNLVFNRTFFASEWRMIGTYPPHPDCLQLFRWDDSSSQLPVIHMTNSAWDKGQKPQRKEVKRLYCYERLDEGMKIVFFINCARAESSQCAMLNKDSPKNWCWIAELDEPFNLPCAQRLIMDFGFQRNLAPFKWMSPEGEIIPHTDFLSYRLPASGENMLASNRLVRVQANGN